MGRKHAKHKKRRQRASSSAVKVLNSRQTVYYDTFMFTDGKESVPDASFYAKHPPSDAMIAVGSEERVGNKILRCFVEGKTVAVQLFDEAGKPASTRLVYRNAPPADRAPGALLAERRFDTQVEYTINSPWHDGEENIAVYTVASLRSHGGAASHEVIK